MIGVAGEDGGGAVELFGEHDAGKLVRPGHPSERDHRGGGLQHRGIVAVGAADGKNQFARAGVALACQKLGKILRCQGFAGFVEGNDTGAGIAQGMQFRGFLAATLPVVAGTALGDLDQRAGAQAERTGGLGEAVEIARRKFLSGPDFIRPTA